MKNKICVIGSFNVDISARVPRFPQPGETLVALGSSLGPGGKGANQAVAAAKAGGDVHFIAKVGSDDFSKFAFEHLSASDISSFKLFQSSTEVTGNAVIYVSDNNGENMIAITPGANESMTVEEIDSVSENIKEADILLLQLEINFSAIERAIDIAKQNHTKIILNPAPYREEIKAYLHDIDIITPNETEASFLSGIEVVNLDTAKQAARKINELGVNTVIITLGKRGSLLFTDGQFYENQAYPVLAVDTTGAGDAFNGAFVAALSNKETVIVQALNYASAFSGLAVERHGASNIPTEEEVKAFMKMKNRL